jgi:hypothetical protein
MIWRLAKPFQAGFQGRQKCLVFFGLAYGDAQTVSQQSALGADVFN